MGNILYHVAKKRKPYLEYEIIDVYDCSNRWKITRANMVDACTVLTHVRNENFLRGDLYYVGQDTYGL